MNLTVAYITARKQCCFDWFLDSLTFQTDEVCKSIRIVVVDFHNSGRTEWKLKLGDLGTNWVWTPPKPCVWQGQSRLTKENWFAASNARNTALCFAPDGYIAYVDDLSVLTPDWLKSVKEAMAGNYVALGAYSKVKNLVVEKGIIKSFSDYPEGRDSRWSFGKDNESVPANGGMMYGCSVAIPVEALLTINGFPEDLCDGLGSEDYCAGLALENSGYQFRYDRRMMTIESEELHHAEPAMRKEDWHFENGLPVKGGNGRDDKSHSALNIAKSSKNFPNSFGEGGIRALRLRTMNGECFPVPGTPDRDWYTKQLLCEI